MSNQSAIEWTEATWNPVVGCSKVSPGCANCYAETRTRRFAGRPGWIEEHRPWTPENAAHNVVLKPERLDQPLRWRRPRMVFVNSMSDLFHEQVPDGYILDVFRVMAQCPQHTFQVLTKRPERARDWFARWADAIEADSAPKLVRGPAATRKAHTSGRARLFADMIERWGEPPPGAAWPTYDWAEGMRWWPTVFWNVWLGVSIENARHTYRADILREIPAAVRFISAEPLLDSLFAEQRLNPRFVHEASTLRAAGVSDRAARASASAAIKRAPLDLTSIDWLIIGGESGPGARPCDLAWIRELVAAARAAGTAPFVKQLGARPIERHPYVAGVVDAYSALELRDRKGGDPDEWPEDLRVREFPTVAA